MPDEATFQKYEKEIEIPVCLNLGLSYLKTKDYQLSIKYCTQALGKEPDNDKALYRRGMSYLGMGDITNSKADLTRAYELTGGKDSNVIKGLQSLKEKIAQNKEREKELVKKIFQSAGAGLYDDQKPASSQSQSKGWAETAEEEGEEEPPSFIKRAQKVRGNRCAAIVNWIPCIGAKLAGMFQNGVEEKEE